MKKRNAYCEKCGAYFHVNKDCTEFTCPCCNEKYIVSNGTSKKTRKIVNYEKDRLRVSKDYEADTIEELKQFHYEYVSTEPDEDGYVWINVQRKEDFKYKDDIVKKEEEYKKLCEALNEAYFEMNNLFPTNLLWGLFLSFILFFCFIPIMISFDYGETAGVLAFLIELVASFGFAFLIAKMVHLTRINEKEELIKKIMKKIDIIFKELEYLNEEDNINNKDKK